MVAILSLVTCLPSPQFQPEQVERPSVIYSTINMAVPFWGFSSEDVVCATPYLTAKSAQDAHHGEVINIKRLKNMVCYLFKPSELSTVHTST